MQVFLVLQRIQNKEVCLKRYERINLLRKKGNFQEEDSVFRLPKVKTLKLKVKKGKAAAQKDAEKKKEDKKK